jgi:Transcriptional Coactivator p15 (PC4)
MSALRPTLDGPVIISKFWRSRNHAEHIRVELSEYEGHPLGNVRLWQTGSDGVDRPSKKGIALSVRKLPELAKTLALAETKARALGLLEEDGQS